MPISSLSGFRILGVDDDPLNLELITIFLRQAGAEVETVESGPLALEKLAASHFDLIILDLEMPGVDGLETAARIRQTQGEIPLVALTGHSSLETEEACRKAGFTDVIVKPVRDWPEFSATVESHLVASREAGSVQLDFERIRSASGRLREIFDRAADELPIRAKEVDSSWRRGDRGALKRVLHQLRGTMANCGFSEVARIAGNAEDELGKQDVDGERLENLLVELTKSARATKVAYRQLSLGSKDA